MVQESRDETVSESPESIPPCLIFIDKEGRWYHQGVEMIHRDFVQLFYQNMRMDSEGRYIIEWDGATCYVDVEDTAFVVTRVSYEVEEGGERSRFLLSLSDDSLEALAPETLRVGKDHVLYCSVKSAAFPARFSRPAYYQLAQHIEEDKGVYLLPLNGQRYPIREGPAGVD